MPLHKFMALGAAVGPWPGNYGAVFTSSYSNLPSRTTRQLSTEYGSGHWTQRQYGRPIEFAIEQELSGAPATTIRISFFSVTGGLLGRIHTDAPRHIMISSEMNFGPGQDCRDAIIKTVVPPLFEVPRFSIVEIKVGDNRTPWFRGKLTEIPEAGSSPELPGAGKQEYVYEVTGFSADFENLNAEGTYSAGLDVGGVVYSIIEAKAGRSGSFNFNPGKIDQATGTLLQFNIDVSLAPLNDVMEIFAQWARAQWGCDGSGDFFFRSKPENIAETLYIQNSGGFSARSDTKIANSIIVKAQQPAGSERSGTRTIAIVNNLTSQAKYGVLEKTITITGDYSGADGEAIGQQVLADSVEPRINASARGLRIKDGWSKLDIGLHRWISPFGSFDVIAQECDNLAGIGLQGAGDAALSIDNEILHDGAGSCRIDFQNALDQAIVFRLGAVKGRLENLTLWIRSTQRLNLQIGIGETWDENPLYNVTVGAIGRFFPMVIDLTDSGIEQPAELGIKILDNQAVATTIHADSIRFAALNYRYFDLRPERERYTFSAGRREIEIDYNQIPPRLEDFIGGLEKARKELQFVTEEQ